MRKKGTKNKSYSYDFKLSVILDMLNNHLGYSETMRKYFSDLDSKNYAFIKKWERIYLEEGTEGLMKERRGRASEVDGVRKGRPPKLDKAIEEDLISENQRLRMENEYLKKLIALVQSEEENEKNTKRK